MPADEARGDATMPSIGFITNADDTLRADGRDPLLDEPMEPFFGHDDDDLRVEPPPPARRPPPWPLIIGGAALAVLLAVAAGRLMAPGVHPEAPPPAPPARADDMTVTVDPVAAPAPPPPRDAKAPLLEVLAPEHIPPPAPRKVAAAPARFVDTSVSPPASAQVRTPEPVDTASPCAEAGSVAEQMICEDPGVAAADRRMNRAYAAALAAGVPRDDLRADQDDWLQAREDAAVQSRRAMMQAYRERIGELEALAGPPPR